MKKTIKERKKEEENFMLKCFLENEPDTDEGRTSAFLDFQFIQGCLEVQRMRDFNKIGTRKTGYMAMLDTFENLLSQRIMQDFEYGIIKKKPVLLSLISSLSYRFVFKYIKLKGADEKKRRFKDTKEIFSVDYDSALFSLKFKLKKLKEELVEIIDTQKELSMIHTSDGEIYNAFSIEIIDDVNV